jgi:hypothetical protein
MLRYSELERYSHATYVQAVQGPAANHWIADEIPMSKDARQFQILGRGTCVQINIPVGGAGLMQTMFGDVKRYLLILLEAISAIIDSRRLCITSPILCPLFDCVG